MKYDRERYERLNFRARNDDAFIVSIVVKLRAVDRACEAGVREHVIPQGSDAVCEYRRILGTGVAVAYACIDCCDQLIASAEAAP